MCSLTGEGFIHSIEEGIELELTKVRGEDADSQIIHINIITEAKEINLPSEEITFHVVKASG